MKLNNVLSVLAVSLGMATSATFAADNSSGGNGQITFKGSVIEAACSINPDDQQQDVYLGQIAASQLANNGTSRPVNFEINLQNCVMDVTEGQDENGSPITVTTAPSVTVSFGGARAVEGDDTWFGINGTATGAGVVITDVSSNRIPVGGSSAPRELIVGDNTLGFSAYLQGVSNTVTTGEFQSIVDFTMTYE